MSGLKNLAAEASVSVLAGAPHIKSGRQAGFETQLHDAKRPLLNFGRLFEQRQVRLSTTQFDILSDDLGRDQPLAHR